MENRQVTHTSPGLTRRQQAIYDYLVAHQDAFAQPPTLDELCQALGLRSRGSLHKHVQALVDAGLVEPMHGRQRGVRLSAAAAAADDELPLLGYIAAGQPIEAVAMPETMAVPTLLHTEGPCYVLQVKGESMVDDGILDGDWVIIESRNHAHNGEVVVALIDGEEATLKRLEQQQGRVVLHPANSTMAPITLAPDQLQIQGVLVGLMRRYG